ncbi:MAG: ATP-binding protein [Candidatus Methanomethylicota archaeon]|uniref:ATP-binding protein n=1 Tax=Thermoproteota archaeon TaxID=2056631 RepID=A0A497ENS4_9CREN|nr:MAG: ATP-binding protein [Candidatus Verstraetearchaeota archaeon]
MQITINNFKSIENVTLRLRPLTILLGPPASGKSNILDAMAFIGYFNKLRLLREEYNNNAQDLEPLALIARFDEHMHIFRQYDLSRDIVISVDHERIREKVRVFFEQGKLRITVNDAEIPWDLRALYQDVALNVREKLISTSADAGLIEARLYGYDRYGLAISAYVSPYVTYGHSFHHYLRGIFVRSTPVHIMSELGWNVTKVIRSSPDVVNRLNRVLREYLSEEVELRVLREGNVVIFDYGYEVSPSAISDSVLRSLYYLMALRSTINYVKVHGLENKFILMLEEPEAHVFPFLLDPLIDYALEAIKCSYVIMTTHNPLFVSRIWDRASDIKTYYVYRNSEGTTCAMELDVDKLAKELKTIEEILYMMPNEVIQQYLIT